MRRTARCDRVRVVSSASGFTLIELLVAIAIMAVVAILSWRGLDEIVRGRETITRSMAEERVFAQMFDQMRIDLREAATDDAAGGIAISLDGGALQIVRAFPVPPGAAPRLQVVRYRVSGGQVVRYASPPLANLGELRRALRGGEGDNWGALPLMRGVDVINARLFVPKTGWTSNMEDVRSQVNGDNDSLKVPQLGNAPLPRAVTGVQISVGSRSLEQPVNRVFLVGE
ncbi:MAG TPA: prepilin-type N-terminal cleavage/methylation domain-containing protein [Paraburkholderia sp.]